MEGDVSMCNMKRSVLFGLVAFVGCYGSVPDKGPPVAQVKVQKIVARVGEDLKILCPVEGSPAPIVRWYKDEEVIDHTWTRIKATRRILKIKNSNRDDTGIFLCKAVNGFGSAQVRVELIVIDPRKYGVSPMDKPLELAPPVLTKKTQKSRTLFKKLPGDTLVLDCEALGSPQPSISWLHNGVPISASGRLEMTGLTEEDSGTYSCVASNLVGKVRKEFSLTVSSPLVDLPVIHDISNVSVREGETGVVQCSVSSSVPAHVKWLREVNQGEDFTVSVGNMRLVMVESGELSLGDGMYMSNLVIKHVRPDHQGLYVCFATNTAGGFNYKTTTLTVNPIDADEMEGSSMVLALVIGLTMVVLILLVVLVICSITERRKLLQPESPESSRTLMPQTPSTTRQTLTIQRNYLDFGPYEKAPSDGINSLRFDSNHHPLAQNGRCSSAATNHYDVPYSHLTQQSLDHSHKSSIPYHHSEDYSIQTSIPYQHSESIPYHPCESIPYHPCESIPYQKSASGSTQYITQMSPLHLHTNYIHEKDMMGQIKNHSLENRNESPGGSFRKHPIHPYFQYVTVRDQGNLSNDV